MTREGGRWQDSRVGKIFFPLFLISFFISQPASFAHTRLYACVIGNDSSGSSMGGSSLGAGLWQSDDSAKTWKQLGWKHVKCYSVDIVDSSNGRIIFQACGNGVLRSIDAGKSWKMLTDWRITEVMDIAIDQREPNNIYIATPEAIWKSDDGGNSWFEADTDIPYPIFISRIKIDPKDHLKVYAATEDGLYQSSDGGALWKKVKGSGGAVRDMIIGSAGIDAWVDEAGGFYPGGIKHPIRADSLGGLWSILRRRDRYIVSGAKGAFASKGDFRSDDLKNIHSITIIGTTLFMSSLDGGVWKKNVLDDGAQPYRAGLETMQVWRIKAVEVE